MSYKTYGSGGAAEAIQALDGRKPVIMVIKDNAFLASLM